MKYTLPELPYDSSALERHYSAKLLALHHHEHVLHSLLWKNLSPRGGGEPDGELAAAVKELFGSCTGLERQLTEAAMNIQGSGWGALGWEPLGGREACGLARRREAILQRTHARSVGRGTRGEALESCPDAWVL